MPKLSNMIGETGTVEIPVAGDEPLIVTYRRGVMTPRIQKRMMEMTTVAEAELTPALAGAALDFVCDVYGRLIDSWNLTDDSGAPIGTTPDALSDVDVSILKAVVEAIGGAGQVDPLSGSGSSNGSPQTASSEPLRIISAS
jgi:hypothetical protein